MHRSQVRPKRPNEYSALILLLAGLVLLSVPAVWAEQPGRSTISGVVRDARGVAQMGALVQVLGSNAATAGTAFTDPHGRYVIANLTPGRYAVRASATLFVPATRGNLQLRQGAAEVVNLTLAALFDTASWLPAQRRRAEEPDDDWKWTLRSTANRPLLRIVDQGTVIEVSSSAISPSGEERAKGPRTSAREAVASGDGGFGTGGLHDVLSIHRVLDDGADMVLRSDISSPRVPFGVVPSQEFDLGYERSGRFGSATRTLVSFRSHPELIAAGGAAGAVLDANRGLQNLELSGAQRTALGDLVELEFGSEVNAVQSSGRSEVEDHPFLRLTAHPSGTWTLQYRMATDRELQGFDDVTTGAREVPVALVRNGRLELERGRHQEFSASHKTGRAILSAAYYHDAMSRTAVSGGGAGVPAQAETDDVPVGMVVDPTTGTFGILAQGYSTSGVRVTASTPLADGLWVAAEYSTGEALASSTGGNVSLADAVAGLSAQNAHAITVALKGHLATGTRLRASYRWQQANFVTAIDPYSAFGDQAFFSCLVRQPIRIGNHLPRGLAATIDVTNLLAEGYRPFLSADGHTLYFAQAPRTIQAGLSFSF